VLWGQCQEGEIAPPYGPWTELLGAAATLLHPDRLQQRLGAGAAALAPLIPQVGAALPELPPAAALTPDDERFRLQDAVAQLVLGLADEALVVLVLDDLHWADRDSLRLLRHVARFVRRARLLLVGTYRDVEVDRGHPLADTLAMLRHEVEYTRVSLTGWTVAETAAYLGELAGQELPQGFVRRVQEEAAGSPFYTGQIFRHLVESGTIVDRDGSWSTDGSLQELGIPEGVRQVVGRRLAHLSEATGGLLRQAAALSGSCGFELLLAPSGLDEPRLLDCLDEALAAGLIRAVPGQGETYEFAHTLVRHTLYDELSPSRRLRLHRRLAEVLEATAGDQAAAEIAAQYHASAGLPGAEQGLPYALRAADQAQARYAPEQAVALLRLARDLAKQSAPAQRAEVLQRLAVAEAEAVQLSEAPRTVEAALAALSEARAETDMVVGFLETVARALKEGGAAPDSWEPLVERGLALLGERRDLRWARLALLQDHYITLASGSIQAARWLGHNPQAVALARSLGDEDDYARTLDPLAWRGPAETAVTLATVRTWSRPTAVLRGLNVVARDLLYRQGEFRAAAERAQELLAAARRFGSVPNQAEALAQEARSLVMLGRFSEARETYAEAQELVERLGPGHRLHFTVGVGGPTALAYYTTGDWPALAAQAERSTADPAGVRGPLGLIAAARTALAALRAGSPHQARGTLEELEPLVEHLEPQVYLQNLVVSVAGTAVWELEATELATLFRRTRYSGGLAALAAASVLVVDPHPGDRL
jgi:hypothetical protein